MIHIQILPYQSVILMDGTINGIDYMASEDSNINANSARCSNDRAFGMLCANVTFNYTVYAGEVYIDLAESTWYQSAESDTFINCIFKNGIYAPTVGDGGLR